MIIGLTGTKCSGKEVISDILTEMGFKKIVLSDGLKEELIKNGNPNYTIKDLQDLGNELRKEHGNSILAKRALEKLQGQQNILIDGVRNIGEVEEIKKHQGIIVAVDAPLQLRYERLINRKNEFDPKDWEGFIELDRRDKGVNEDDSGQQVGRCIEIADYLINNDSTLEQLKAKVYLVLEDIAQKDPEAFKKPEQEPIETQKRLENIKLNSEEELEDLKETEEELEYIEEMKKETEPIEENNSRPSWDQYFLGISRIVATRATCDRGKSGCVITKDKHILVTGYVGAPAGLPHCDEVGHQLETTIHEDKVAREHCIRTAHAEQNAICHAAKLGIPIEGGTLYCKMVPCSACAKMIINSGIKRVVAEKGYQSGAKDLMEQTGIIVEVINPEIEKY